MQKEGEVDNLTRPVISDLIWTSKLAFALSNQIVNLERRNIDFPPAFLCYSIFFAVTPTDFEADIFLRESLFAVNWIVRNNLMNSLLKQFDVQTK